MFLKIGNQILNDNHIISAKYEEGEKEPKLYIRVTGGDKESGYTSHTIKGENAMTVWNVLCKSSTDLGIEPEVSKPGNLANW
jgi:hypothetical protein